LQRVVDWAASAPGWSIAGAWDAARHVGALSLIVPDGITAQDLSSILDTSFEIAVRPGLHCSPYIHQRIGTFPDGTLRLSPGPFTTDEHITTFLTALDEISAGVL
jgi:selenocysteine lyase/cysteine desulfurase